MDLWAPRVAGRGGRAPPPSLALSASGMMIRWAPRPENQKKKQQLAGCAFAGLRIRRRGKRQRAPPSAMPCDARHTVTWRTVEGLRQGRSSSLVPAPFGSTH
ncbi:hypothetical protein PAHAL_2G093700 [Panicum hallii]|uniref:Uncharacterized protein n=1 Tax=Panicum hallii TaxID=206008 RepID=A0A2S3GX19_9POAL|nr:hypothetical protein PAHAL_2G093700 [Panicum hallii]